MLDKLFGSHTRVKLLKLFLLHSKQRYYIREIARNLSLQLNSVHRELVNLEELGIIRSGAADSDEIITAGEDKAPVLSRVEGELKELKKTDKKADKKFYQANRDFVFFNEIKALIIKSQIMYEKDFADKLKKLGKIKLLVLTGFFVGNADSNIDLLMVGDFNKTKLVKLVKELESELVREVNYSTMTDEEFTYRREIADVFLYNVLDGDKIVVLDEGGFFS
jgi:DNA-binding Lrp family transcriptional regulator